MLSSLGLLLVSSAMASFNIGAATGSEVVQIPSNGVNEICVIPAKYPDAKYSKKDLEQEKGLCSLGGTLPAALCPKMVSTNPGTEFYTVPQGLTSQQLEAKNCKAEGAKKMAKYKASTSCSYTPSILGYYHLSRMLGNIVQVPPAVERTMELQKHLVVGAKGVAAMEGPRRAKEKATGKAVPKQLLQQTWEGYLSNLRAGAAGSKRDLVLTSDYKQSYGALQLNPRSEEKYTEMFNGGSDTQVRAVQFGQRNAFYALVKSSKDLRDLVGTSFTQANVQKFLQMKDVSELIVMDTIMNQFDRFGNVHYTMKNFYIDTTNGQNVEADDKMTPEEAKAKGAVQVKAMMLKDNDCGVAKGNVVKNAKLADSMSHISPETYTRLMRLNSQMDSAETRKFFKEQTLMTDVDYKSIRGNMSQLANLLKARCKSGALKLDLDFNAHFTGKPVAATCDSL